MRPVEQHGQRAERRAAIPGNLTGLYQHEDV